MTAAMSAASTSEDRLALTPDCTIFRMRPGVELLPLDSSATTPQYLARDSSGKSFALSESLKGILVMLDGERSLKQVALELSRRQGAPVSEARINEVIEKYLLAHGLVEHVRGSSDKEEVAANQDRATRRKKAKFDFVFKVPLIKPKAAVWLGDRFTWLYRPRVAALAVAGIIFAHAAFYSEWFRHRDALSLGSKEYLIAYLLVLLTAVFHEIGHAAACRTLGCEHGAIGFLLYIVFPAFYVNLSNAWRLSGRQRAIIDVGGVYFQLISAIPFFLVHILTGSPYCAAVIYSIDVMVLISLNPFLKFDGYWLLVDLTGLVNLQRRGFRVCKEVVLWSIGLTRDISIFKDVRGTWRKLLLAFYSLITVAFFSTFLVLLVALAPNKAWAIINGARQLTMNNGTASFLLSMGRLLMNAFFLLFVYRLLSSTLFRVLKKKNGRRAA